MPGFNAIDWFEIGTGNPEATERFYADVLGWTVARDPKSPAYSIFTTGDPEGIHGGLFDTGGRLPSYAVFSVIVEDCAATCRTAEDAGGKVLRAPVTNSDGLTFAHLLDPDGNHFEIFTPPPVG
jgi:uncharacterized protein